MQLDDLTKEIKAQLYDRVRSPLFGAFALSWAAWNYKLILAVLSGMDFDKKLAFIDKTYPTVPDVIISWFFAPLFSAVLFLVVYPVPALWAYEYWADRQRALKEVQQKMEDETPLTQEEANVIRKTGMAQVAAIQEQLNEMTAANDELQKRLKLLQEENARLTKERGQFEEAARRAQEQLTPALDRVLTARIDTAEQTISRLFSAPSTAEITATNEKALTDSIGPNLMAQMVFVSLISLDGEGSVKAIAEDSGLRQLEVREGLRVLEMKKLILYTPGGGCVLSDKGQSLATDLGLPAVFRQAAQA